MIDLRPLLAAERAALLDLLADLSPGEWAAPSPCPAWSVHELAVHLVHDDLRRLSAQRDRHEGSWIATSGLDDLAVSLDEANERWVAAVAPTLSPRLARDMLDWLTAPTAVYFAGLRPEADGATVSWAGPGPHPNWLDVARELTERWVHQQQIRQATRRPGLAQREYVEAVVDTFARALPASLPPRPEGTEVQLRVTAPFERSWTVAASSSGWAFVQDPSRPDAVVELAAQALWRRAVRMLPAEEARRQARVQGDAELAAAVLDLRAAIVQDPDKAR